MSGLAFCSALVSLMTIYGPIAIGVNGSTLKDVTSMESSSKLLVMPLPILKVIGEFFPEFKLSHEAIFLL